MNKSVMKFIKTVKRGLGKRSPEILLGIGIASGITATVLAVKATPKALELLTEKRYEKYGDTLKEDDSYDDMPELKLVEVVKATWKCYIPAAISGAASIACLLGSHSVHAKRNAALATAYKLSETALNEYREKVVEEIVRACGGSSYFNRTELSRLYRDVLAGLFQPSDQESLHDAWANILLGPIQ